MTDEEMQQLVAGEYYGARVDYRRNFPDMPPITRVFERVDDRRLQLWMTDGPQEVSMMTGLARGHSGRVLVTGLGMGIVQQLLLERPGVTAVVTVEAHSDVSLLHADAAWFADPRHEVVLGDAREQLPRLVAGETFDGYLLDHRETVGDRLEEKVALLRLLDEAGQSDRSVSMWGFWWEVEQTASSDDPDTAALLAAVGRCARCGRILAIDGDPADAFAVVRGADGMCETCEQQTAWAVS